MNDISKSPPGVYESIYGKAHDYQKYVVQFILNHPIASIILDLGLGKTLITLLAVYSLLSTGEVHRILVVAPKRTALLTWPGEIKKWGFPIKYAMAVGDRTKRVSALQDTQAQIVITNRESIPWLAGEMVKGIYGRPFDMICIDELSSFKNGTAKRSKALCTLRPDAKRIIGLTGSPGSLMDLWGEYRVLDGGERLGRYISGFRSKYFTPGQYNPQTGVIYSYNPKPGADETIYEKVKDITISMKSGDYLDLPDRIDSNYVVHMSDEEAELYRRMKKDMILPLMDDGNEELIIDAGSAAVLTSKLLQLSGGAIYTDEGKYISVHDKKITALQEIIEDSEEEPVLVACWYKHEKERILKAIPEARVLDKVQDFNDWNAGTIPVGLIHPAAAGHGVNLQDGGHILVWFSPIWSLELYQQTIGRLYRQGQTHSVLVQHIITEGTIDEAVLTALASKDDSQEKMIAAVKAEIEKGA